MSRKSLELAHRDDKALAMGCSPCETLGLCGGLHISARVLDCDSFCECTAEDRATCQYVCRNKPDEYARREREVNTFDLHTVPHTTAVPTPTLPRFVPLVFGRSGLNRPVPADTVAVPLDRLFALKTGKAKFEDGTDLRQRFGVGGGAKLVVSGVNRDRRIERYWDKARRTDFRQCLKAMAPDLVTVPNFSLFNNVPREDNLHAMKRIAICWQELAAEGFSTALHLNGRTHRDWERWLAFLRAYPEVNAVAFEFATGPTFRGRGRWHANHLVRIARAIDRPLTLVVRGGYTRLRELAAVFDRVVFLSATPYLKTMKRQRLVARPGPRKPRWRPSPTPPGGFLDPLLRANVQAFARLVETEFGLPGIGTRAHHN